MEPSEPLHTTEEIRSFLGVDVPGSAPGPWVTEVVVDGAGYRLDRGSYDVGDGDTVPALLLRPGAPTGAGIVVFHQHNREWHLGKSEVAGFAGDPLQAIAPTLAAAGVTVLAPDAVGFEDRRTHASGTDVHPDDGEHHWNDLAYRLVMGDTLARKLLQDAVAAVSLLTSLDEVDPQRVGAVGHSFGGHTVLFLGAIDPRVSVACVSGAAGSYQARMRQGIPIGYGHVVPGIAQRMDFDTLVACIAPRPLLLVAGTTDRWAVDAQEIAERGRQAYEDAGVPDLLQCEILDGGHPLTTQRHELICDWTRAATSAGR